MQSSSKRVVIFVALVLATFAFDQGSKAWARTLPVKPADCGTAALAAHTCHGVPQPVIAGFWDWELAMNDGAAFSSWRGSQVLLSLIAIGAIGFLCVLARRTRPEQRLQRVAYAMIAGGALGNLLDRVRDGAVVDFVHWKVGTLDWPIFNVADVALVIGVALLVLESIAARRRPGTLAA